MQKYILLPYFYCILFSRRIHSGGEAPLPPSIEAPRCKVVDGGKPGGIYLAKRKNRESIYTEMSEMIPSNLFGEISGEYCVYFYLLSVVGLVFFVISIVGIVYIGIRKSKGFDFFLPALVQSLAYFIIYLQNRLLFNMCSKTL